MACVHWCNQNSWFLDPVQNDLTPFSINLFQLEIPITINQRDSLAFMWVIEISLVSPQKTKLYVEYLIAASQVMWICAFHRPQ